MSRAIVSVSPSTVGIDRLHRARDAREHLAERAVAGHRSRRPRQSTDVNASHGSSTSSAASAAAAIVSKAATISASISASLVGKWR